MTRKQKLIGIALVALIAAGATSVAVRAAISPATPAGATIAGAARHACVEGTFEWRWNLPFASTCDEQPDAG
jgi:hypothetical protein